jgi:type II secretory pathway pseudopilin PulG
MVGRTPTRGQARGFAYLVLLFMVALLGVGLAAAGVVWDLRVRREKEADLLFIGAQFRHAIDAYYDGSPTAAKQYPQSIDDLLEDKRFPNARRYLRRLYRDPFTNAPTWGLIVVNGRLVGVYSLAPGVPVRQSGFLGPEAGFIGAHSYADWRFVGLNAAGTPPPLNTDPAAPATAASATATAATAASTTAAPATGATGPAAQGADAGATPPAAPAPAGPGATFSARH